MTLRSGLPEVVEFSASGGGVALRPVTPAVMAEQPLDDNVVSSHGYTTMHAAELIRLASRPDSKQRSIDRVADPPREVKELLRAINETRDFWKALRTVGCGWIYPPLFPERPCEELSAKGRRLVA